MASDLRIARDKKTEIEFNEVIAITSQPNKLKWPIHGERETAIKVYSWIKQCSSLPKYK